MGKAPAFQFYPSDWIRDLDEHPLEIEGAWIRICCKLFYSDTCGKSTKTLTQWSRILRVGEKKSFAIIGYLDKQNIADVINQNGSITISSRRMVRDEYIRNIRRQSGSKGGNPALIRREEPLVLDNQNLFNQKPTPSSSSSSSNPPIVPNGDDDKVESCPYAEIRALWKEILPELPQPREENKTWHKECRARWLTYSKAKEGGLEWCRVFFNHIRKNPHWMGGNDRGWTVDLGWIWKEKNFYKIVEKKL